ncbi:aspartic proteinase CDR1-like [Pyrus ussuriensis x Pyrus communis]|uniref:Aspartic proteinase CDR1-like n=1 Tax=Pyrus ussuriensis x Pyrus communis TaxID=2448454 RepID=A0A5N5HUM7_9ROSA|nr:aspartic proteinase CDR1-like [Pyrus ussuriensis x Pyrus communis]
MEGRMGGSVASYQSFPSSKYGVLSSSKELKPHRPNYFTTFSKTEATTEGTIPVEQMSMNWIPYNLIDGVPDHVQYLSRASLIGVLRRLDYYVPYVFKPKVEKKLFADTEVQLLLP